MNGATIKCIVVGDFGSGKSALMRRIEDDIFELTSPTIGVEFHCVEGLSDSNATVWNLAGSPRFEKILDLYYVGSQVALLIIDSTQPTNVGRWVHKIQELASEARIILVFTKIDLPMHYTTRDMESMTNHYKAYDFIAVSSKEMERRDIIRMLQPCFHGIRPLSVARVGSPPPEERMCLFCAIQ